MIVVGVLTTILGTLTLWWDELFPTLGRPHLTTIVHLVSGWYWVIGGLAVIIVLVVEGALKAVNQSESKLQEYVDKAAYLPNISIRVNSISVGELVPGTPYLLTVLAVTNTGAPSILDGWAMTLDGYPEQKVEKITFVDDVVWPGRPVYHQSDQMHLKVAEVPVPAGGKKVGFMLWKIPGFDVRPLLSDSTARLSVTVTATDVTGRLITSENRAKQRNDKSVYYPGLQMPGNSPKKP